MVTDAGGRPARGPEMGGGENGEGARLRRNFFASHGLLPPRSAVAEPVTQLAAEPRNDCVFLGPSGSGKTALLSAFGWAGTPDPDADPQPLALGSLADLVTRAERGRAGSEDWPASEGVTTYSLQVRLRSSTAPVLMTIQDSSGRLLFPFSEDAWTALPGETRLAFQARCLVLCVDAVDPQPGAWLEALPRILAQLVQPTGSFSSRPSPARSPRNAGFPRLLTPELQLPFERVLVALTRTDRLIAAAQEHLGAAVSSGRLTLRRAPSRTELALHLDPVLLLVERLPQLVGLLRPALASDAQLAVGLTSAWGLEAAEERRWRPFGARECLRFLIDGRCAAPVAALVPNCLAESESGEWSEIKSAMETIVMPGGDHA